jgi:serine/threonine-protein kinase
MDTDTKLRVALLAHQRGLIDAVQLARVCTAWAENKIEPVQFMRQSEWITSEQVEELNAVIGRQPAEPAAAAIKATSEKKQSAAASDDLTYGNNSEAPAEAHSHTVDFQSKPEPAPKDRERTDRMEGGPESSTGHLRKVSLETIDLKTASRSHYTLSRVHGKGGLGQVWLAIDSQLNREVALKELKPDRGENSESCSRLIKEAQITGQLEHPNIIPVYELVRGADGETPFYTMRFMRGRTLKERIDEYQKARQAGQETRLELQQLLNIFVGVCNALAYAHARGVVHRDLKPHNVMLGDFGEVIVIDWGLAKTVDQPEEVSDYRDIRVAEGDGLTATVEGKVLGTPAFASPEQADGKVRLTDARSDIYGLGAILYMILTGRPPHRGTESGNTFKDTMELLKQISTGPTPLVRAIVPSAPPALDAIAAKAMAKERAQRYAKASELADDVQRWLADEPVSAYRDPWPERLRRWTRRHRTATQAAAIGLVVVALVAVVATVFVNRARRQAESSLAAEQKALKAEQVALDAERDAKTEALRRFKEARDAVDKSLTGVSSVLQYYPGVQTLRTELLKKAAEDYERFANEKSDDLELRAESGRAYLRLGDVRQLLVQHKEAQEAYRSAESLFDELSRADPDNVEFALELARARSRLGSLYTVTGPTSEADREFDAAIRLLEQLVARHSGDARIRYERAVAQLNRVPLLKKTARLNDARALLEQVESDLRRLTSEAPDPRYAEALGAALRELGQMLSLIGRNDDAVAKLREAIPVYRELALSDENHPPYLEGLAATRVDLANALRRLGKDSDAIAAYRTSITDFDDLLIVRPDVPHYRHNRALSRTNLAQILHIVGLNHDAKAACLEAMSEFIDLVNRHADVYAFHADLATTNGTLGTILRDLNEDSLAEQAFRGAIDRFRQLAGEVPEDRDYRRRLAIAQSALARTLHKVRKFDDAKSEFLAAIETFEGVTKDTQDDPIVRNALAWCYTHFGDLLRATEHPEQATVYYAKAMALRESLDKEPDDIFSFAWFLANCEDVKFRDADRAVRLADEARKRAPENARYWNMLGLAQYRAEKYDEAIKSLAVASDLRGEPKHASDWFVMAMAQWKKDDKDAAKASFDRAVTTMDKHCPGNIDVGKLRREAAELLENSLPNAQP